MKGKIFGKLNTNNKVKFNDLKAYKEANLLDECELDYLIEGKEYKITSVNYEWPYDDVIENMKVILIIIQTKSINVNSEDLTYFSHELHVSDAEFIDKVGEGK